MRTLSLSVDRFQLARAFVISRGAKTEAVQFACNTAQLQDLVAKLKDAAKSLENAAAS